jgi:hypothetical protein
LKALGTVASEIITADPSAKLVLMGDFNADCGYLPQYKMKCIQGVGECKEDYTTLLWQPPALQWLVNDTTDTTVGTAVCAYDRVIVSSALMVDVLTDSAKAYQFDDELGLSNEDAKIVSDHYPVEFILRLKQFRTSQTDDNNNSSGTNGEDGTDSGTLEHDNTETRNCTGFDCNSKEGSDESSSATTAQPRLIHLALVAFVTAGVGFGLA